MPSVIRWPRHWSTIVPSPVKWMPTFVPSSFSSTISDSSASKRRDSASPRCLSSSVPLEPKRWGVLGYLTNSSCDRPTVHLRSLERTHLRRRPEHGPYRQKPDGRTRNPTYEF